VRNYNDLFVEPPTLLVNDGPLRLVPGAFRKFPQLAPDSTQILGRTVGDLDPLLAKESPQHLAGVVGIVGNVDGSLVLFIARLMPRDRRFSVTLAREYGCL
jgi:hypothetical protein